MALTYHLTGVRPQIVVQVSMISRAEIQDIVEDFPSCIHYILTMALHTLLTLTVMVNSMLRCPAQSVTSQLHALLAG